MKGIFYGVGVGPGDPELITLKALRCINESDVIILPSESKENCYSYNIVKKVCPEIDNKKIVCLDFPMIKDKAKLKQIHDDIAKTVVQFVENGNKTAFLTIGDPTIYSTYSYIRKRVLNKNLKVETINGIPSFCAAAAQLGISLGDNREEIHIIPASYDIEETLCLKGTRIYMKSGKKLMELKKALEKIKDNVDITAISNCTMENQKIFYGIEGLDDAKGYLTLVIVKNKK